MTSKSFLIKAKLNQLCSRAGYWMKTRRYSPTKLTLSVSVYWSRRLERSEVPWARKTIISSLLPRSEPKSSMTISCSFFRSSKSNKFMSSTRQRNAYLFYAPDCTICEMADYTTIKQSVNIRLLKVVSVKRKLTELNGCFGFYPFIMPWIRSKYFLNWPCSSVVDTIVFPPALFCC